LLEREYDGIFSIIAPVFKDDNKWRLSDGNSTLNVSIMDKEFLERVDARKESFYKGDLLRCKIRTLQWRTENGLKTEHEVLQVIDHIQSGYSFFHKYLYLSCNFGRKVMAHFRM